MKQSKQANGRIKKQRLYDASGQPVAGFNRLVKGWLEGDVVLKEHNAPAAFAGLRTAYCDAHAKIMAADVPLTTRDAHRLALSGVTAMLFGHDIGLELKARLESKPVNEGGFRTTLSQGVAKNVGENFVNAIVYALADLLEDNEDVLVDKGLPPSLKPVLCLMRDVPLGDKTKRLKIPIEGDMTIFSRSNPLNAVVISAKTRLKEVFHIGTMWKLFFDMMDDEHCRKKWNLQREKAGDLSEMLYVFATADMVNENGLRSQGSDVDRPEPRNLIAMDASFFDYVLVSKNGIPHVSTKLAVAAGREALFHELGCIIDLIEQKFGAKFESKSNVSPVTPLEGQSELPLTT